MKWVLGIDRGIDRGASGLLIASVIAIALMSLMGVVLRWAHLSPLWIDPLVRHLVFLSAFFSGIVVIGRGKHIAIDLLDMALTQYPHIHQWVRRLVYAISILSLSWLVYAGIVFLRDEIQFGRPEFLGIHSAFWVSAVPIGLALMAFRFFALLVSSFRREKTC